MGRMVNRLETIAHMGSSKLDNEECWSITAMMTRHSGWSISTTRPGSDTRPLYRLWQSRSDAAR